MSDAAERGNPELRSPRSTLDLWHWPTMATRRRLGFMDHDIVLLVGRAIDAVEPVLASVSPADHVRSTPCRDFDLGTLVAHLVGGLRGFADVGEGKPLRFDADPDIATEAIPDAYRHSADRLVAAFRPPGCWNAASRCRGARPQALS